MGAMKESVIEVQDIMNAIWAEVAPDIPCTEGQSMEVGDSICFGILHDGQALAIAGNYATRTITCTVIGGPDTLAPLILHFSQYSVDDFYEGDEVSIPDYGKVLRDHLLGND